MPASRPVVSSHLLLRAVLQQFLPGAAVSAGMPPLVLVDPTGSAATPLLRDLHSLWIAHDAHASIWLPGRGLGRELAAAEAAGAPHPLERRLGGRAEQHGEQTATMLIVPRVDQLGPASAARPFVRLLEMAIRSGVLCCVSLAAPAAGSLEPRLASRLAEGLVLPLSRPMPRPATAALEATLRATPRQTPGIRRVIAAVARLHGLQPDDLVGPSRRRGIAEPRAIAMFVLRLVSNLSFYSLGRAFGGRDHTTVMHAVKLVGTRIANDPATAREVERLIAVVTTPRNRHRCRIDVG